MSVKGTFESLVQVKFYKKPELVFCINNITNDCVISEGSHVDKPLVKYCAAFYLIILTYSHCSHQFCRQS